MAIGTTLTGTKELDQSGIYKITIGPYFYFGSAKVLKNRKWSHIAELRRNVHPNRKMQNFWNKYQEFQFEVIEMVQGGEEFNERLLAREQHYIDVRFSDPQCMNLCPTAGNTSGVKHSEESRKNMSKAHMGLQCGMFHPRFGKTWSDEQRNKYSKTKTGAPWTPAQRKSITAAMARPGVRERQAAAKKGKPQSAETIEKRMSKMRGSDNARARRFWLDHPTMGRMEFGCSKDASKVLGVSRSMFSNWLLGASPWPGEGAYKRKETSHLMGLKGGYF